MSLGNSTDIFEWGREFETGIEQVDDQHQKLVAIINRVGKAASEKTLTKKELDEVFKELVNYTSYHFADEEELMKKTGIYEISFQEHIRNHRTFLREVTNLKKDLDYEMNEDKVRNILDFLVSWLAFHILGQDQNMSRQINLINRGVSPKKAYETVMEAVDNQTAPLVKSLNGLMKVLSKRNAELLDLNEGLEKEIENRTQEVLEANKKLRILAFADQLTGVPNRRHLMEVISIFAKRCQEGELDMCGIMLDLDRFKEVNDTYGHDMGDKVLREFTRIVRESIRTDDIVARLGGDEFFVVCPNADENGGVTVANNLLKNIKAMKVKVGDGPNDIWYGSSSIGVAYYDPQTTHTPQELIKKADEAVYAAKEAGKGCVRVYGK